MNTGTAAIVRFKSVAEANTFGYTLPDKAKDTDATPAELRSYISWTRFRNEAGQLSVPVWLDESTGEKVTVRNTKTLQLVTGHVVQMYPPK